MSRERRMIVRRLIALSLLACSMSAFAKDEVRVRARDLGVAPGIFAPARTTPSPTSPAYASAR